MDRVDEIFQGPWTRDAELAITWLQERRGDSRKDRKDLNAVFRPHWERKPTKRAEKLRASFDAALTPLMLLELAIATGYVNSADVSGRAQAEFQRLLLSAPARQYLDSYDYVGVRYLAARLRWDLDLDAVRPPQPIEAPTLFASFLAQFRDWYEDDDLDTWLNFLDDFVVLDNEANRFRRYLRMGQRPQDEEAAARFDDLLGGLDAFLRNLYDILGVIPEKSRAMFGLVHVYWIAGFFGYELEDGQYVQDYIDWSPAIAASPLVTAAGRSMWDASLATIRDTWFETRTLVESTRVTLDEETELEFAGMESESFMPRLTRVK